MDNGSHTASSRSRRTILFILTGVCILLLVQLGFAGDILRGGAAGGARKSSSATSTTGSAEANIATANAKDRLARTTTALNSVKNLQAAARAAAGGDGVPDGLQTGA